MARRFAQKNQPFDEPNEKNDDATSGKKSSDAADVEDKGGGGVILSFALQAFDAFQCNKYLSLNKVRSPVWHILSEDEQGCSRAVDVSKY